MSSLGYLKVQKELVQTIETYGPSKLAFNLMKNRILCPIHYYIITTLKKVSASYQSSVLFELLKEDLDYLTRYEEFKQFVRTEKSLMHIYSKMSNIGKLVQSYD